MLFFSNGINSRRYSHYWNKTNNSTDPGNDCIKLVTLVDLQCNSTFTVTDNNWNNATSSWACDNNEFAVQITCNTAISQGSIFYISVDASGDPANCSGGTITKVASGGLWGTDYGLSSVGDNVYVLQGTRVAPQFIYAIKNAASFSNVTGCNKSDAGLPSGLTLGTSALALGSGQEHWHYNCVTNNNTKAAIRSAIGNSANWLPTSTSGQSWNNLTGIFTITNPGFSYGVLAVSGPGCGYFSGCSLAYSGGVNGAVVGGDCTANEIPMTKSITVPTGCTYLVTAEMKNRPNGCSSSGADGSGGGCPSSTCDALK